MAALNAVFIVVLLSGIGFYAHRRNIIQQGHSVSLTALLIKVLMPAFIFSSIAGNEKLLESNLIISAPLCGALFLVFSLALGFLVLKTPLCGRELSDDKAGKAFIVATAVQNYGYFAIPLLPILFPENHSQLLGVLLLHNVGVEIVLWTLVTATLRGKLDRQCFKQMINPPFIAVIVSLFFLITGLHRTIPNALNRGIQSAGAGAIPIGLMLVGATLSEILLEGLFKEPFSKTLKVVIPGLVQRQLLLPAAWLGLIGALSLHPDLHKIMIIQAAMPAAFFPIVLARHFEGNVRVVALCSVSSFILSPLSVSLWLWLGNQ